MKRAGLIFGILLLIVNLNTTEISFGLRIDRGLIENNELTELSGIALSNQNESVLWSHNDSGGDNAVYAMDINGNHLGKYYLEGVTFRDLEDIAVLDFNGDYLLLADIGDNNGVYGEKYIYKISEPEVAIGQEPVEEMIASSEITSYLVVYSGGEHYDSETIFTDNNTGDIYLVTKRGADNPYSDEYDHVFKIEYPQNGMGINEADEIALVDVNTYMDYGITGGDLSHSGRELLLRTYDAVYYWEILPEETIEQALENAGVSVTYELEPQGEAICWSELAGGYYSSSEENGGYPARLSYYPRLTNYIQISELPTGLYRAEEDFQIIWGPAGLYSQLYLSDSPGGEILENYEASGVWGEDILISSPADLGLSVGVYRGILHNPEFDYLSIEFPIIVESGNAVQMVYPPNGGTISESLPVFEWSVNPGVPYYLIGVSDTPFEIDHDENGETIVTGIETVWQALTYETSLMYGMPDPSGYFSGISPPLIPNQEYNWIVVNNYGNDPLLSSKVSGNPFSFYYSSDETIGIPELTAPEDFSMHSSFELSFSWTEVLEAMYYHIQVFEIREQGSNTGNYLVWEQTTTNNSIDMNAEGILIASDYNWKVYATSSEEVSSVSETGYFSYDISVGTLALRVRDNYGSAVPFATVEIDPIEGSSDDFPLAVNAAGNEDKVLPIGEYIIEISKEGFEVSDTVFTISENEITNLTVEMVYSPSYFYGQVVDESGYLIDNVTVTAISDDGEEREADGVYGNYLLSVTSGEWSVRSEKSGWQLVSEQVVEIESGENILLEPLVMFESIKDIEGSVVNTSGLSMQRAKVSACSEDNEYFRITNANGHYSFTGIGYGNYEIKAEKPGYSMLNTIELNITAASPDLITLENLVLQPASMINGSASDGTVGIKEAVITAIPSMGSPFYAETDEYGDYIMNLLAGTYNIGAYKENYTNQTVYQVNINTGETLDNLDFVLLPNDAIVSGNVFSEGSGLEMVQITAGDNHTLTLPNGDYQLSVYPGTYNLQAFKQGYTVNRVYRLSLGAGEEISDLDFIMYPNASVISGKTHHNGTSISGAAVFAEKQTSSNEIFTTESDSEGEYSYSFGYGTYKLWAGKPNFVCLPEDTLIVTVAPGEEITGVDINLTPIEAYIVGRVVNGAALGIEGASITAESGELEYNTITGNYGNFEITVEPGLSYNVTAAKSGYSLNSTETGIIETGEEVYLEIILQQLPSTISGRVMDEYGGALSGATVTAEGSDIYSTESSFNGSWIISLFAGDYTVRAEKAGYIESVEEIVLIPGSQIDTLDFYLEENFAVLDGFVLNANLGVPLENVLVMANYSGGGGSSGYSDEFGYYRLEDLIPGLYESIGYSKTGFYSHVISNSVLPGSFTSTIDVMLEPYTSAIEAYVSSEGEALSGATVSAENQLNGEIVSEITDNSGYCILTDVSSLLPYNVSVSKANYSSADTLVYSVPDDTVTVYFDIIRIDGSISGIIYDQNGNPVNAAAIRAQSEDGYSSETVSGFNGGYILENLAVNRYYSITVEKQGYSQSEELSVYLGEETFELDITLYSHIYRAEGILHDQEGYELEGIQVYFSSQLLNGQTISDNEGVFEFDELAPYSEYSFWTLASENGYENISWQDTIYNENIDMGILTVPVFISSFLGNITDYNTGEAIGGALVTAENLGNNHTFGAISQPDGSYRIRYLYGGIYDLQITAESYSDVMIESVSLGHREEMEIDIEMHYNEPVQVSGVVSDSENRTYQGVEVNLIRGINSYSTITDENGDFQFPQVLPYSEIILTTSLPSEDYDNAWQTLVTGVENISGIVLEIDVHSSEISGIIQSGTENLANAQVSLSNADVLLVTTTGSNGIYSFESLYEGSYELSCYCPGYAAETRVIEIGDFEEVLENFNLVLLEGSISGVVSGSTEPGLENAIVEILQDGVTVATDTTIAGGSFQFEGLSLFEEFEVRVIKLGFQTYIYPELVMPGESILIELSGIANSISGTVYYENDPFAGSEAIIRNLGNEIQTTLCNEFGDYLFSNVSGFYYVWAEAADSLTTIIANAIINPGESSRLYLSLTNAAEISGYTIYSGLPKPGVTVTATNVSSGRWYQDITEQDGLYELRGLIAGNYELDYYCAGYEFINVPELVTVETGESIVLADVNMVFMQNALNGIVQRAEERIGIRNAIVTLKDSLNVVLDFYLTEGDGTFLFNNLEDGIYNVSVEHPAYYEADEIEAELSGGISNPGTVEFNLVPRELHIYGYVGTDNGAPVGGAVVWAEHESGRNSKVKQSGFESSNPIRSITDTTNADGYYQITADTIGTWRLAAECAGYISSEEVEVELSWEQSWYQQNFYIQPDILYGGIRGSIRIFDEIWKPLDTFMIRLYSESGLSLEINGESDTLYSFEDLVIPEVFSLELYGVYNDELYHEYRSGLEIQEEIVLVEDFDFYWQPESWDISGYIFMKDDGLIELEAAELSLYSSEGQEYIEQTSPAGFYRFSGLEEDIYDLQIRAEYEGETFFFARDSLLLNNDIEFNHYFQYLLCELGITITDSNGEGIEDVDVYVSGEGIDIELQTNSNGNCTTGTQLHTGTYQIATAAAARDSLVFLGMEGKTVYFDSLGYYELRQELPLWFEPYNYSNDYNYDEEIGVFLFGAEGFQGNAVMHYVNTNGSHIEQNMIREDSGFGGIIPQQNSAGSITMWFSAFDSLEVQHFDNEALPCYIKISSEGIPSEEYSRVIPADPVIPYGSELDFEVQVKDALGNDLNSVIETEAEIAWSISDGAMGTITPYPEELLKVRFTSAELGIPETTCRITAEINYQGFYLQCSTQITTGDYTISEVILEGVNELANSAAASYDLQIFSETGRELTLPYESIETEEYAGIVRLEEGLLKFMPSSDFIGKALLVASVKDPETGELFTGRKSVTVYQKVNSATPEKSLNTGLSWEIEIYESMLNNSQNQARLYVLEQSIPPYEEVDIEYETRSKVIRASSNLSETAWQDLPGITFHSDEENLMLAKWNNEKLTWEILSKASPEISHIPHFAKDYSAIAESRKLGIYDLKLLPNPFTPYDMIGSNPGLQISFRLSSRRSRYIKLSAKIYTLSGELVREIASGETLQKGEYHPGEKKTLYWDGNTDKGKLARNGRYILHLIAEDSEERQEIVKTIVLIK